MWPLERSVLQEGGAAFGASWSEVMRKATAPANPKKLKEMRALQQERKNEQ